MNFTKAVKTDLDSLCLELSNGGLEIVIALSESNPAVHMQ